MVELDLYNELVQKTNELNVCVKQLRTSGTAYAEAEKTYKVILRQEVLKMRDAGNAVGIINMTVYGVPVVADARFKRDVARTVWEANQEAINALKLQMRLIEGQLKREWGQAT